MKKLLLAMFAITIFAVACEKTGIRKSGWERDSYPTVLSKCESKVQALDRQINFVHGKQTRTLKKGVEFIVADVGGGLGGFNVGSKLGAFAGVYGPLVTMGGTVLGAVIGSGYYWWKTSGVIQNPTNGTTGAINILAPDYLFSTNSYTNNEEKLGYLHNMNCRNTFTNGTVIPITFESFYDEFYTKYVQNISSNISCNAALFNSLQFKNELKSSLLGIEAITSFDTFVSYIKSNCDDKATDDILFSLVERLYQVPENKYDLIFDYTNSYIQIVLSDTTLNQTQKDRLLFSFNIVKYSASLWKNNC